MQYQQLLVHFAFRIRCALCRRLGCGGGAKALPGQLQRPLRCLLQRQLLLRVGGLRRTGHHQHILAARLVGLVVLHRLAEGSLPDILVQLCQLPAQGDAAVCAKGIGQIVQRGAQLVGRFVKDGGALFLQKLSQPLFFLLAVHGQKALEHPAGGVLPGHGQRCDAGGSRRYWHYLDAPGQCVPHDHLARVGDAGHARITAQGTALACFNAAQDALTLLQGVLIVADHGLFQTQKVQQLHGHTGVLGGNKVCRAKGGCYARRHIVQIADGRCHDIKSSCHSLPPI